MKTYFIAMEDGSNPPKFVKIGRSTSSGAERKKNLQVGNPYPLYVLRELVGDFEVWLHSHYAHLRTRGEWFRFDDMMLTIIPPAEADAAIQPDRRPGPPAVIIVPPKKAWRQKTPAPWDDARRARHKAAMIEWGKTSPCRKTAYAT